MNLRSRLLGITIGFGLAACGDDSPYVPQDAGPEEQTFTKLVIDLINNHTDDPAPVAYEAFKDVPDPDGDNNNVNAYDGLFQ
jgi:hypothetical protein